MNTFNSRLSLLYQPLYNSCSSILKSVAVNAIWKRNATKKTASNTSNNPSRRKPKHRGVRVQDGCFVQKSTVLVKQNKLRFHPGLNVAFGKDMTLSSLVAGKVMVTCEKMDVDWNHSFVKLFYDGRQGQNIYKKYFHVIPKPQHNRFKLIDMI